jgi:hypothetical protein
MKPSNNTQMLFFTVVLTVASSMMLSSCGATLRDALTMKAQGLNVTYPLPYDQTYKAMRTALIWSSGGMHTIEDHQEQGCILSLRERSQDYDYRIIWLDSLDGTSTRVTLLTDRITGEYHKKTNEMPASVEKVRDNMDYAAQLIKDGKPLPIRR